MKIDYAAVLQANYLVRLAKKNIPSNPAKRTPAQATLARTEFEVARMEATADLGTITQTAIEVK